MPALGPHTSTNALAKLDRRTKEGRLLRAVRVELLNHLGPSPSAVQRQMVEQAAMLTLQVRLFDCRALVAGGVMTEHDRKAYLAFHGTLVRILARLGIEGAAAETTESLEDIAAEIEAAAAAEAAAKPTPAPPAPIDREAA